MQQQHKANQTQKQIHRNFEPIFIDSESKIRFEIEMSSKIVEKMLEKSILEEGLKGIELQILTKIK